MCSKDIALESMWTYTVVYVVDLYQIRKIDIIWRWIPSCYLSWYNQFNIANLSVCQDVKSPVNEGFDLWPFCTCPVLFRLEKLSPHCTYVEHWSVSGEMFSISDRTSNINCVFVCSLSDAVKKKPAPSPNMQKRHGEFILRHLQTQLSADYIVLIILVQ